MKKKALSLKIIELVGSNPDGFDEKKEQELQELLKPINHEMDIGNVKWQPCKGNW